MVGYHMTSIDDLLDNLLCNYIDCDEEDSEFIDIVTLNLVEEYPIGDDLEFGAIDEGSFDVPDGVAALYSALYSNKACCDECLFASETGCSSQEVNLGVHSNVS